MPGVAVVTDSTADIPAELAEKCGLRVVPMTVSFGEESYISGVTIDAPSFYERMRSAPEPPTTSQPSPAWFEEAYGDAADDGATAVVSIHLSGSLSGTCALARLIAAEAPLPVEVIDSGQAGGALALVVFAAVRAAARGASATQVATVARRVSRLARLFFAVDSLEALRRGGRLGGTQAFIGSVLRVKPILTIEGGRVVPLQKVRTWARATERLAELAGAHAAGVPSDVVVSHGLVPEVAALTRDRVLAHVDVRESLETVIGPVLASHAGPGTVGVAVAPALD